jgi:hypothetical protein
LLHLLRRTIELQNAPEQLSGSRVDAVLIVYLRFGASEERGKEKVELFLDNCFFSRNSLSDTQALSKVRFWTVLSLLLTKLKKNPQKYDLKTAIRI